MTAGAQIKRFLILHKELDADDGEVTRTQKVRRGFVAERYAPLIKALYDGSSEADISTEVTFEDGRKGMLSARVKIRDVATVPVAPPLGEGGMRAPAASDIAAGEVLLSVENVSLSFGGVQRDPRRVVRHHARARSAPSSARTAPARPRCSTSSTASISRSRAASPSRARRATQDAAATTRRAAASRAPSRTSRCSGA